MANAKQVLDIRGDKGVPGGMSDEIQRRWSEKAWAKAVRNGNYDRSRAHLNFEIVRGKIQPIDTKRSIPKRIAKEVKNRDLYDRNVGLPEPKYRTIASIIFGGSRERMLEMAFGKQTIDIDGGDNSKVQRRPEIERWAMDIYRFACKEWGKENVVSFVCHLDELNPHIHATILPVDDRDHLHFKNVFAGENKFDFRDNTLALHDRLAIINKPWGLYRGDPKELTGAKHRTTEQYRRAVRRETQRLEQEIEESTSILNDLRDQIQLSQQAVKGLQTMIENLRKEKIKAEDELAQLKKQAKTDAANRDELQKLIEAKEKALADIDAKITDKEAKQATAQGTLNSLLAEIGKNKETLSVLRDQTAQTRAERIHTQIMKAGFESVINSFGKLVTHLSSEQDKELFDGTMLSDLAKNGSKIVTCAGLLFAGMVDKATDFAHSNGGGGGSSDQSPWGRDPKDDDRIWALKCLHQAHKMMKPSPVKRAETVTRFHRR
ncbi:MAG: plasmid recombination protein [Bacteroidales bacterium]|nr:plasmid recombination protein [Bacteroidales bacterium]